MSEREKTSDSVLIALFNGAVNDLASVDLLTNESVPAIRRALKKLDDFHARLRDFDSDVFPRGPTRKAIERIRGGLRVGEARAAFRELQALGEEIKGRLAKEREG